MEAVMAFDNGILDWIQQAMRGDVMDQIMAFLSWLGEAGMVWILIALVLLCRKKTRKWGIVMAVTLLAGLLLGEWGLKNVVQRVRPCNVPGMDVMLAVPPPSSFSFPSGHTMSSFEAATILWAMDHRWGTAAYGLAAAIAFSRMYLYVHYPTDVLAGALFGVLLARGVLCWAGAWKRKQQTPQEGE